MTPPKMVPYWLVSRGSVTTRRARLRDWLASGELATSKRTQGKNAAMSQPLPQTPRKPERAHFAALPTSELVLRMRVGVENFDARVVKFNDAQLDQVFPAEAGVGLWSCRTLLGHLADSELADAHRIRRLVAEENPVLGVWDENAFADLGLYGKPGSTEKFPVGLFIATVHTLRQWTTHFLGTLDAAAWSRRALHPEKGELTVRTLVEFNVWHLEHHAWYLNRKVEMLAGK